jgi:hypothetical protein
MQSNTHSNELPSRRPVLATARGAFAIARWLGAVTHVTSALLAATAAIHASAFAGPDSGPIAELTTFVRLAAAQHHPPDTMRRITSQ